MDNLICKRCGYIAKSRQGFNSHIAHAHHLKSKEYYDLYLKQENDGICPTCGKETAFRDMWYGYNKHCCTRCIPLDPNVQEQMKQTCLEKFGTEYSFQAEEVKEKIQESIYNHFGVKSYLQTKECREIIAKNSASQEVKDKIKQTNLKNRGVECSFQANDVKEKIKQTKKERYNDENYNNVSKAKQTSIEHFGVDNPAKSIEVQNKMKDTCLKKFGVDNIWKDRESRMVAKQKSQKSMNKNGNDSSLEDFLENSFNNNNIVYIKQYNADSRYPYFCDFYLPDSDTFVEINGYFTHNGHWFDKNNLDDINTLNIWKEKAKEHSMYETCIRVWTDSDVKKRNSAKNNKLNYVVLWSKQDILDWIDSNFQIRHDY